MHLDPALPYIVGSLIIILLMGLLFKHLKQPHVVGYIIVGIILGPHVFNMIGDQTVIDRFGSMGVVFLLFYWYGGVTKTINFDLAYYRYWYQHTDTHQCCLRLVNR